MTTTHRVPTLDTRYGRTPQRKRRDRWLLISGGIAAVAIATVWAFWAGWDNDQANLETTDTAYTIPDDRHVDISFSINAPVGTPVTCALQALNEDFAIVGWRIVEYPGSPSRLTAHTESIRTIMKPNTGLINTCWLS